MEGNTGEVNLAFNRTFKVPGVMSSSWRVKRSANVAWCQLNDLLLSRNTISQWTHPSINKNKQTNKNPLLSRFIENAVWEKKTQQRSANHHNISVIVISESFKEGV